MDGLDNPWLSSLENSMLINLSPLPKWEYSIAGEHYRNELTAGTYKNIFLIDTQLSFKLSRRLRLSANLNNILNRRTYNYTTYSQLSSFESQRWIRGREFLILITLQE